MRDFQDRVRRWLNHCLGVESTQDKAARTVRFLEEAIELGQACGATAEDCHVLVDYVYSRPVGERAQEVGGVMVTLAALCHAHCLLMDRCGERELESAWTRVEEIRRKQKLKPHMDGHQRDSQEGDQA